MNRKLSDWASIAEIISSIAVVVTLVFLIIEIRGNTDEIRAATLTNALGRNQDLILTLAANSELAEINTRVLQGEELSTAEAIRYGQYFAAYLRATEESFIAYRDGRLEEEIWLTRAQVLLDIFDYGDTRRMWSERRGSGWYIEDFARWLDTELAAKYGQ